MGSNKLTANYRLIYFQPDPEDGERVCVALLFNSRDDVELLYDSRFPKLRCLASHIDPELVSVYLDEMAATIKSDPPHLDLLVRRHGPQFVTSGTRQCLWPLTDTTRHVLMARFLSLEGHTEKATLAAVAGQEMRRKPIAEHLKELVRNTAKGQVGDLLENVDAKWVLGTKLTGIRPVALAWRKPRNVLLIDGIDLTVSKPGTALSRAGKVTHTFWQYRRALEDRHDGVRLIGIVLNGRPTPTPEYRDVHDFALHQFRKEADLAVDASSPDDIKNLAAELNA